MKKYIGPQFPVKNQRKSKRLAKKFLIFINQKQFMGHDISVEGLAFAFNSANQIALLKQQTLNVTIVFSDDEDIGRKYDARIKVTNLRHLNSNDLVYGCQILDTKAPHLHKLLLDSTPKTYPDIEAVFAKKTATPTIAATAEPQAATSLAVAATTSSSKLAPTSMLRGHETLLETAKFVRLLQKQSVNEDLSCDEFRELVLLVTNKIIEKELFKRIDSL